MKITEQQLKENIKEKSFSNVYLLYGAEAYLTEHYAKQLEEKIGGNDDFSSFNAVRLDGESAETSDIMGAAETLPLMSEVKTVLVKDLDMSRQNADDVVKIIEQMPDYCFMIFWQSKSDFKVKSAAWKKTVKAVEKHGIIAEFPLKSNTEIVRLLCSGAKRRECILSRDLAMLIIERCGSSLRSLLGELDKICFATIGSSTTNDGEQNTITRDLIEKITTESLESSVFTLSKAIFAKNSGQAFSVLDKLFARKEDPVSIAAVLSNAYADLYRAKVAENSGELVTALTGVFNYKGKEFRLKNAARDARKISAKNISASLAVLSQLDESLKSTSADKRLLVEHAVMKLMMYA